MKHVDLGKARSFLMGLSIFWVALFHYKVNIPPSNYAAFCFNEFVGYGFFGVDIFLFLSGFGLCYSFRKNPDPAHFFLRRMRKLLPTYYAFLVLFILVLRIRGTLIPLDAFMGNITCTGHLFGFPYQTNWYIQSIWVFYIIFPFLYYFLEKAKHIHAWLIGLIAFSLLFLFVITGQSYIYYYIFCRIPAFILGIYFGIKIQRTNVFLSKKAEIVSYIVLFGDYLFYTWMIRNHFDFMNDSGLRWTLMTPMIIGFCALGARIHEALILNKGTALLNKVFEIFGIASLELLMWHLLVRNTLKSLLDFKSLNGWQCLGLLLFSFLIGIIFHYVVNFIADKVEAKIKGSQKQTS